MSKKFYIVSYCVLGLILAALFSLFVYSKSTLQFSYLTFSNENLIALNKNAVKGECKKAGKNSFMYFEFSQVQRVHLQNYVSKNKGASFVFSVLNTGDKESGSSVLSAGFLYPEDFAGSHKLKKKIDSRPLIKADFSQSDVNELNLAFAVSDKNKIPSGFFVHGENSYILKNVNLIPMVYGWRKNSESEKLLFAFSDKGGSADFSFSGLDFSSAQNLFGDFNFKNETENKFFEYSENYFPEIKISLEPVDNIGTPKNQVKISGKYGNEKINIRRSKNQSQVILQSAAFDSPFSELSFNENVSMVKSIFMSRNDSKLIKNSIYEPIPSDLGLIVDWPQKHWRNSDFEIFEWNLFPGVLFFDFASYKVQNEFLTRMAYFAEKAGFKGTLVSDYYVENMHGYNAHDYKAKDMAEFYTKAVEEKFLLNKRELLLRDILVHNKIILENEDGTYSEGKGAIISFSRESYDGLRWTFLAHESWHGIYFTNEDFRNVVAACYNMFDPNSMDFIKTFWATQKGLGYDPSDEYLMQNEFMAYIMQQSYSNIQSYFVGLANRGSVNVYEPKQAAYIRETQAEAFSDAGKLFDEYAFDNWGLACGRVSLLSK